MPLPARNTVVDPRNVKVFHTWNDTSPSPLCFECLADDKIAAHSSLFFSDAVLIIKFTHPPILLF